MKKMKNYKKNEGQQPLSRSWRGQSLRSKKYISILLSLTLLTALECARDSDTASDSDPGSSSQLCAPTGLTDLIISEFRTDNNTDSGSGSPRSNYVEIYNGTGSSVDLSTYSLLYSQHGDTMWATDDADCTTGADPVDCDIFPLSRIQPTLANEATLVVARVGSNPANVGPTSPLWDNFKANGDDGIALAKGGTAADGSNNIDVVGEPADPGTAWEVAGRTNATQEVLFRKCTGIAPTTDWNGSRGTNAEDSQWVVQTAADYDFSNVGMYTTTEIAGGAPPAVPPMPTNVTVTAGDAQLTVRWDAVTATPAVTEYEVKYGTASGSLDQTLSPNPTTTTAIITGLTNDTTYYVTVAAINSEGTGLASVEVSGMPTEPTVACAPTGLADLIISEFRTDNNSDSDSSLRSNYVEIYNGTGSSVDLSTYSLLYSKSSDPMWGTDDADCTSPELVSADDPVDCDIFPLSRIQPTLANGATLVVARVGSDPANVGSTSPLWANFLANGDDGVALAKGGTATDGSNNIDVVGEPADPGTAWDVAGRTNDATREVLFRKCTPVSSGASYTIAPTTDWDASRGTDAANSQWLVQTAADYDFSNVGMYTTTEIAGGAPPAPAVPPMPTNVTVTAGDAQLTVRWDAVTATPAVTEYEVKYGTTSGSLDQTLSPNPTTTTAIITGLTNDMTYYVTVAAINSEGTGLASGEVSGMPTAPAVPPTPTNVTVTAGDAQLTVRWDAVTATPAVTEYEVKYGTTAGSLDQMLSPNPTTTTATITGLTNDTTYYVTVAAINSAGSGLASGEVSGMPTVPTVACAPTGLADLIISEFRTDNSTDSGAGSPRSNYVEIYNGTGSSVELSTYSLLYSQHGDTMWGTDDADCTSPELVSADDPVDCDIFRLSRIQSTLANGATLVVARVGSDPANVDSTSPLWDNFKANGDDGVALAKGGTAADGSNNIDVVGEPTDPGTAWEVAGRTNATQEVLFRKCMPVSPGASYTIAPTTDWDVSRGTDAANSQWLVQTAADYGFSNVGMYTTADIVHVP